MKGISCLLITLLFTSLLQFINIEVIASVTYRIFVLILKIKNCYTINRIIHVLIFIAKLDTLV